MHSKHTQMDILAGEMTMSAVAAASLKMKDNDKNSRMKAGSKMSSGPHRMVNVHFFLLMVSQLAGLSHWSIWGTISRVPDVSLCLGNYNYLKNFRKMPAH